MTTNMTPPRTLESETDLALGTVRVRLAIGHWRRAEAREIARGFRDRLLRERVGPGYHPGGIRRDSYGRPSWPAIPELCWSNSACDGAAATAWHESWCENEGAGGRVGVDIERIDPSIIDESLARMTMTARELEAWTRDPRPELFFQVWTRKEAVLKCIGLGLYLDPATVDVWADRAGTARDREEPGDAWSTVKAAGRVCLVRSIDARTGFAAAVASGLIQDLDTAIGAA